MRSLIIVFLLVIANCGCFSVKSQTVTWQMKLSAIDDIKRIGADMFKVSQNGKVGLMKSDGSLWAAIDNDQLTLFHDHYALLLKADNVGNRIVGCVSDKGECFLFGKKYYTLAGQQFVSDGVISVSDESGKIGYVDVKGAKVLGFDGKYDLIKPFTEGYAAVFKNKKYHLIDKNGVNQRFLFNGVAEVYKGSNVYNGIAYLCDANGKFYKYDVRSKGVCKPVKLDKSQLSYDYLYRFSVISGKNKTVPYQEAGYSGVLNAASDVNGGLYGYKLGERLILPHQFTMASPFEDGLSIVKHNGKIGILRLLPNESFRVSAKNGDLKFYDRQPALCEFVIDCPNSWKDKSLDIKVHDMSGRILPVKRVGEYSHAFDFAATETGDYQFMVNVSSEGINLLNDNISYSLVKKYKCKICGKDKDVCGGHTEKKDQVTVKKDTKNHEDLCPTCGLPISQCKYDGIH